MDGWKWCCHITDWFEYTHTWNQGGIIISIYDIFLIHFLFCKNTVNLNKLVDLPINSISLKKGMMTAGTCLKKHSTRENTALLQVASWKNDGTTEMYGSNNTFEKQYVLNGNIYQIHCTYAIYGCNCSSKKYRIYWEMVGCNYLREIKKHCTLKKTLFPTSMLRLITVYKEKLLYFWSQSLWAASLLSNCSSMSFYRW